MFHYLMIGGKIEMQRSACFLMGRGMGIEEMHITYDAEINYIKNRKQLVML